MRQVCPTCNREVGNDNICQVCGLVKPIVVEFDAAQAVAQRAAGQKVTSGASHGGGGNALVSLVFLVVVLAGAWFAANEIFGEKGKGPSKRSVDGVLVPMSKAFEAGDLVTAGQRIDQLAKIAKPGSQVVAHLRAALAVLKVEAPDGPTLRSGFAATEYLQARETDTLQIVGYQAQQQLEKKVLAFIERARALADEGRNEKALEMFNSVPRSSEHHSQLAKEKVRIGNKAAAKMAERARAAMAEENYAEAERAAGEAQEASLGELRTEMRKLVEEIRRARARRARALYREGKVADAREMLSTQADVDGISGLISRMEQVKKLAARAQKLSADGKPGAAKAAWEKITQLEPDAENHFVKLAREALGK